MMRTEDNSAFTIYKTATRDWYGADEVDKRIAELELKIKNILRDHRASRRRDHEAIL